MKHVVSWSGGKDSTATVIYIKEHLNEIVKTGDEVIVNFCEVMFDLKNNISANNPQVTSFIYGTKEVFESWGFTVNILRAGTDYLTLFHRPLKGCPDPKRNGLLRGFPYGKQGQCWVKRDLKDPPRERYMKALKESGEAYTEYVGIAYDEPGRYKSLKVRNPKAESLLYLNKIMECDAIEMCLEYNLLSPQYQFDYGRQGRDGCWFCPYAKECEHRAIKDVYPEVWNQYVSLEDTPDLGYPKWFIYTKETLHQRDRNLDNPYVQTSLFDFV